MAKFVNIAAGAGNPPPVPPTPYASLAGLAKVDGLSLFLDFDGTLVDLASRPDGVVVPPSLPPLLIRLSHRLNGRLALISGRGADDVINHLGPVPIAVAGSHGAEIRFADGRVLSPPRPDALATVLDAFERTARATAGLVVEDKPHGAALHYRTAPDEATRCNALAADLANRFGLKLQTGKMMVEVRSPGADKGGALARLMAEPVFSGGTPVFIGDDDTDEPAFVAADRLGGAGVLVGAMRESAARFVLPGVGAVHEWLEEVANR